MDFAKQRAISACGTCGHQEWEHLGAVDEAESLDVLAALGGACRQYTMSDAAFAYQRHLVIAQQRSGRRRNGVRCSRCGYRGHAKGNCPL